MSTPVLKRWFFACAILFGSLPTTASADIILYDIAADPNAWMSDISNHVVVGSYDFNIDPSYRNWPGQTFNGPLNHSGAGPVSRGILPLEMSMNSVNGGMNNLRAVDLIQNTVLASQGGDALGIYLYLPGTRFTAFQFNAISINSGVVDILINGSFFFSGVNVGLGRDIGIRATPGDSISSVVLYDPFASAGVGGAGIQGAGYTWTIPEPGSAHLLGLLSVACIALRTRNHPTTTTIVRNNNRPAIGKKTSGQKKYDLLSKFRAHISAHHFSAPLVV